MTEQVLIQFRVDKELKQEVSEICDALGTDMPTVFRMCMKQMQIARGIPFPTKLPEKTITRAEALNAFHQLRREAANLPEMSFGRLLSDPVSCGRPQCKTRHRDALPAEAEWLIRLPP